MAGLAGRPPGKEEAVSTNRYQPGDIVHAADQDNFGHVIEDDGGPKVHVHFQNPETGQEADPWLDRSLLTPARGSRPPDPSEERRFDFAVQRGHSTGDERVGGRLIISPFDAWVFSRLLAIDEGLNGELANVSAPFRAIVGYLVSRPLADRLPPWEGYLCGVPDPDALVRAIADANPLDPPPPLETLGARRPANAADLKTAAEGVKWLWEGWIPLGRVSGIAAFEGTGKTKLALDLARRVYLGLPAPDDQPLNIPAGSPSLWICGDGHQDELADAARKMGIPLESILFNTLPEDPYGGTSLDDPEAMASLDEFVGISGAKLVYVDTLTNATCRDLCRQDEVVPLLAPLQAIAQRHEIAPMLLQHLSREGQALGRRSKGLTRTLVHLDCPDPDQPTRLRMWVEKSFTVKPPALGVTMGAEGNTYDQDPPTARGPSPGGRPPAKRDKVREFIRDALVAENDRIGNDLCAECEEKLGVSRQTFWRAVDAMEADGDIVTDGGPGTGTQKMLHLVAVQN
jgi:hypothetical protein